MKYHKTLKVSVVIPVYNCKDTIEKCLLSLVDQTYPNKEIIVVDDCSDDGTFDILKKMVEKYEIKIVRLGKRSGASVARNEGIKYAVGEIIFFGEADAYYAPEYIELCVRHLIENPKIGTVIGALHAWPESNMWYKWWEAQRKIMLSNYKPIGGWFFRKRDLDVIGYYRVDLLVGEDRELCYRLKNKLGLEFAYEPKALWYHKYPYSFKRILVKAFKTGLHLTKFDKIMNTYRINLFKRFTYIILIGFVMYSTILGVVRSDTYLLIPFAMSTLAGFIYPAYQLKSRKISLKEFKEYIILFPIVKGLEALLRSLGYIIGSVLFIKRRLIDVQQDQ